MRLKPMVAVATMVLFTTAGATLFYPNFVSYYSYPNPGVRSPATIADMIPCSTRGYLMIGIGGNQALVIKIDQFGKKQWDYVDPDNSSIVPTTAAVLTKNGKVIVACGMKFGSSTKGDTDLIRVSRLDAVTGAVEWEKDLFLGNHNRVAGILETPDGGFLIGGVCYEPKSISNDLLFVKTDSLGSLLAAKTYGSAGTDEATIALRQPVNGELFALCTKGNKTWVLRMNAAADTISSRMYFYGAANRFTDMQATLDGKYLCVGTTSDLSGQKDAWAQKIDDKGDVLWSKHYFKSRMEIAISCCACLPYGGYVATFGLDNQNVLLKINDQGDSVWTLRYGYDYGKLTPARVFINAQERFVIGGTYSLGNDSGNAYYLSFESESKSTVSQGFGNWTVFDTALCDFNPCDVDKICLDSAGRIWVAVRGTGSTSAALFHQTDNGWKRLTDIPGQQIGAMVFSSKGTLWVAGDEGIYKYDGSAVVHTPLEIQGFSVASVDDSLAYAGGTFRLYTLKNNILTHLPEATAGLTMTSVYAIAVDRRSRVWFDLLAGVTVKDGQTYTSFTAKNSPLPSGTYNLLLDDKGAVWVFSMKGLARYSDGIWKIFDSTNTRLTTSWIRALAFSPQGVPAFGCNRGFTVSDTDTLFTYANSPLPSNRVNCLLYDKSGNLWVGTGRGLVRISPNANSIQKPVTANQARKVCGSRGPRLFLQGFERVPSSGNGEFFQRFDLRGRRLRAGAGAFSFSVSTPRLVIVKNGDAGRKK